MERPEVESRDLDILLEVNSDTRCVWVSRRIGPLEPSFVSKTYKVIRVYRLDVGRDLLRPGINCATRCVTCAARRA